MKKKQKHKRTSIINTFASVFVVLLFITVGVTGSIIFSNWNASVSQATQGLSEKMNKQIIAQIDSLIHVPVHINETNHNLIEKGIVDLSNEKHRNSFFISVLEESPPNIYSFSYGSAKGEYYGARRNEKGEIEIMKNNAETGGESWYYAVNADGTAGKMTVNAGKFDPRTRDWYKAAVKTGAAVFSPVYKHFVMDDLTVSAAVPVYSPTGELMGVLGTHMLLSGIGNDIQELVKGYNGYALIAEKNTGYLIANSFGAQNFTVSSGKMTRKTVSSMENKAILEGYERYIADTGLYTKNEGNGLIMNIQDYKQSGLDWLIVSALPEDLMTAEVYRNIWIGGILVATAILMAVVLYMLIARRLSVPIYGLLKKAEEFSAGDLSGRVQISRNDEIGRISEAFNKVADNMQTFINNLEDTVAERTEELHVTNETLEESRQQLRRILDSTAEAIYGTDMDGRCTFCNESCLKLLGYASPAELLGKNMHVLTGHRRKDGAPFPEGECPMIVALRRGEGTHSASDVFVRADGNSFDVEYRSLPQFRNGQLFGSVVTFMDITERKKDEEHIQFLSSHDSMTGLLNRRSFEQMLTDMDNRDNLPISIVFTDLNGLKLINDIFGHLAGDEMILKAAEVIKRCCREGDVAARVGGDEFTVLLPKTDANEAKKIAQTLKITFSEEKINAVTCSLALGIDTKTNPHQEIEKILENAENEMYKDKTLHQKSFGDGAVHGIIQALHEKSPWEKRHSEEVGRLCEKTGRALGLPETEITKLRNAGYFHDIGKISLSEQVLNKNPETLTEDENEKMWQHPAVGYRILNLYENTLNLADGVYGHHERWDGSGYPKGLTGEEIPLISRIISIVETYERILGKADYSKEGKKAALQVIREGAGKRFDPGITALFIRMIEDEEDNG